jgi:hypothetical protein
MSPRRLIGTVLMAGCWVVLLAFVLTSIFTASKLAKQARSRDRQTQVQVN